MTPEGGAHDGGQEPDPPNHEAMRVCSSLGGSRLTGRLLPNLTGKNVRKVEDSKEKDRDKTESGTYTF